MSDLPTEQQPPVPPIVRVAPPIPLVSSSTIVDVGEQDAGLHDFDFLAVLSRGESTKLLLAQQKPSGPLRAIKAVKKLSIVASDELQRTRSEKLAFLAATRESHPFLLTLYSCFQTKTRLYFVMEYVAGGDLMYHIQHRRFSLPEVQFYTAEVLLALQFLHRNGIIYRNLKLDNLLVALDGHIKLVDYAICKSDIWYGSTTQTFCGTSDFMAPEMLLEQAYGYGIDWWAFGVLIYELLLGEVPFPGDDEDEVFDAILEDEPLYPSSISLDAVSILQALLTRDPSQRLGSGPDDAEPIKHHEFFKGTDFDACLQKRIPPPFIPVISERTDVTDPSGGEWEEHHEAPILSPIHGILSLEAQSEFLGFDWTAED